MAFIATPSWATDLASSAQQLHAASSDPSHTTRAAFAQANHAPILKATRPPQFRRWPPHQPAARYTFRDKLTNYGKTETDVLINFADFLASRGYTRRFYHGLPDGSSGFATPFERVDTQGAPIFTDRFNVEPTYQGHLLGRKVIPRRLRTIVYFLTPHHIPTGAYPQSFARHRAALESGVGSLGQGMRSARISDQHRMTAFLYEYYSDTDDEPSVVPDSSVLGEVQLQNSRIIDSAGRP